MSVDEKVISCIFNELLVEDVNLYEKNIAEIDISNEDAKSFYSKMAKVMSNLNEEEKRDIYNFFKIVITDTASVILGTIDGTHMVNGLDEDFSISYGHVDIKGDLQDLFLEKAEGLIK